MNTEPTAEFTVPLREVQSVEGQTVEMSCELSKPGQKVTWLKDGVELKPDDRCEVVVDGCVHRLTIHNATLEDEAEYTVKLTDDVSTKATLWVEGILPCMMYLTLCGLTGDPIIPWSQRLHGLIHKKPTFVFYLNLFNLPFKAQILGASTVYERRYKCKLTFLCLAHPIFSSFMECPYQSFTTQYDAIA